MPSAQARQHNDEIFKMNTRQPEKTSRMHYNVLNILNQLPD
jgi:hypothetical protein